MAKEKKPNRFVKLHEEIMGMSGMVEILLDTETGVNYLFYEHNEGGGLTPLLDKDGKLVITPNGKGLV